MPYAEGVLRRRLREILPVALEPLGIIIITLGPVVALTTLSWVVDDRLQSSWAAGWGQAVRLWLLAFGVPIDVGSDALAVQGLSEGYSLTIAPLGLLALALWRTWVSARRSSDAEPLWAAWAVFVTVTALLSLLLGLSASDGTASVSVAASVWHPVIWLGCVFVAGSLVSTAAATPERATVVGWVAALGHQLSARIPLGLLRAAWRAIGMTAALLFTAASIMVTVSLLFNWMAVVAVYDNLHAGWVGVITLTGLQLLYLPNLLVFAAAWLGGAGFALGTGSLISPFVTQVAPLPSIPLLAALPQGSGWQSVFVVVAVAAALGGAWYGFGQLATDVIAGPKGWGVCALLALAQAAGTALLLLLAGALASGALGPGRLQDVGVAPARTLITAALVFVAGFAVLIWQRLRPGATASVTSR